MSAKMHVSKEKFCPKWYLPKVGQTPNSFSIVHSIKEFTNETYTNEETNPNGFSEAKLRSLFRNTIQ